MTWPWLPDARGAVWRDPATARAAAIGRQPGVAAGIPAPPHGGTGAGAAALPIGAGRRVWGAARFPARLHRPLRRGRPPRPESGHASAALVAAARRGTPARPRITFELPDRHANIQRRRKPHRAGRA